MPPGGPCFLNLAGNGLGEMFPPRNHRAATAAGKTAEKTAGEIVGFFPVNPTSGGNVWGAANPVGRGSLKLDIIADRKGPRASPDQAAQPPGRAPLARSLPRGGIPKPNGFAGI